MACRLPVIISNKVNIWREVERAKAGLVVDCNIESLSEAMNDLIDDKEARAQMGEAGRKLVQATYAIKPVTDELRRQYRNIIDKVSCDARRGRKNSM